MTRAVIMAGGRGERVQVGRDVRVVKTLLPFGERTILELQLASLAANGIRQATICVHYEAERVKAALLHGAHGLVIEWSDSGSFHGTVGPLSFVDENDDDWLVLNGDILAPVDFAALVEAHVHTDVAVTVVVHEAPVPVPYGVVEVDSDGFLFGITEKPTLSRLAASGIYVLSPRAREVLRRAEQLDMPEFIERVAAKGLSVRVFRHHGPWHDLSTPAAFLRAAIDYQARPKEFDP